MIYHIPVLLALGSVFVKRGEIQEPQWKPSKVDVMKLREGMANFEAKVVNGRRQYPFELYLQSKGILSFGEYGEWQVCSPLEYTRASETYGLHKWMNEKDQAQFFQAYPEEKSIWQDKMRSMFESIKSEAANKKFV